MEQQSHLLDLLDISRGATSISSPPLGAAGGAAAIVDPWAAPSNRAASQLSDPWAGAASPHVDPWHPSAAPRTIMSAGVPLGLAAQAHPQPLGAPVEAWRTQSPSGASGSSNEGWLQTNGNASQNGRLAAPAPVDAWLTKTTANAVLAAPLPTHATSNGSSADPWLSEAQPAATATAAAAPADPWAAAQPSIATLDDPWKALQTGAIKVIQLITIMIP